MLHMAVDFTKTDISFKTMKYLNFYKDSANLTRVKYYFIIKFHF